MNEQDTLKQAVAKGISMLEQQFINGALEDPVHLKRLIKILQGERDCANFNFIATHKGYLKLDKQLRERNPVKMLLNSLYGKIGINKQPAGPAKGNPSQGAPE